MNNRLGLYRLVALAFPALLLIACGGAPQETAEEAPAAAAPPNKIIGTWDADVRAMMVASMPEGAQLPPEMEEMLKEAFMTVEFNADGTNVMTANMGGEEREDTGSWELVSQEGNTYALRLTSHTDAGEERTQDASAVFTDDDNVRIALEGEDAGPAMILKRRS